MHKLFTKFFLIAFIVLITAVSLQAQKKYYILFDNMENEIGNDGVKITNLIDICYWDFISEHNDYKDYIVRAPLSPSTLAKYDLSEMDVAIFVLGSGKGLSHVQNGIKIYDKVQEMINAGKRVAIIGHNVLSKDLDGNDSEVKNFWKETLGVDQYYTADLQEAGTYESMEIRGLGQPIADGWIKRCNSLWSRNNLPEAAPIRFYDHAEFFTLKEDALAVPFDRLLTPDEFNGKKVYSGLHAEMNGAKLAIWTVNFDIASTNYTGDFVAALNNAMQWFTIAEEIPKPFPYMSFSPKEVDFDRVELDESSTKFFTVKNYGKESFDITDAYINPDSQSPEDFEILDIEQLPITLETHEEVSFRVKFAPQSKKVYESEVNLIATAENIQLAKVWIHGSGGVEDKFGAEIGVTGFPMDFGSVDANRTSDLPLEILSIGNLELIIDLITFEENADLAFDYAETYDPPYVLQPGDKMELDLRFFPGEPNKEYEALIGIKSNATDVQHGWTYVKLKGRSNPSFDGPQIEFSAQVLEFGNVDSSKTMTVQMNNTGDRPLYVESVDIEADPENLEVFEILEDQINAIPPDLSGEVNVKFTPKAEKEYFGDLVIVSNSKLYGVHRIAMGGFGTEMVSVEEGFAGLSGLFEMRLNPNPVTDNSVLEYTLIGNTSRRVDLVILDAAGKQVASIQNSTLSPGTYSTSISSLNLASGAYVLAAKINQKYSTTLNFVIAK